MQHKPAIFRSLPPLAVLCVALLSACGGGSGSSSTSNPTVPTSTEKLAAGASTSFIARADGSVWAWGTELMADWGYIPLPGPMPAPVAGLSNMVDVADSTALRADGTIWVWGYNKTGLLGTATTDICGVNSVPPGFACTRTALPLLGLPKINAIASSSGYRAAVGTDGSVWAWGNLYSGGSIGNGVEPAPSPTPHQLPGLAGITNVSVSDSHALALRNDGKVLAWGYNLYGQLGTPINGASTAQVIEGLNNVTSVAAASNHSLALTSDGRVWVWGTNYFKNYGSSPVALPISGVTTLVAGSDHTLVLKRDGTLWAWGRNRYGQLGNSATTDSPEPVQVTGLTGAVSIAAGADHSLAIASDGSVWTWGRVHTASVEAIDSCSWEYIDTHGVSPSGKTITVSEPCSKRPVKVKLPKI